MLLYSMAFRRILTVANLVAGAPSGTPSRWGKKPSVKRHERKRSGHLYEKDWKVYFSGFERGELDKVYKEAADAGCQVVSGVGKNTTHLIFKGAELAKGRLEQAELFDVHTLKYEDFLELLDPPSRGTS